jgi:hypothetical protein
MWNEICVKSFYVIFLHKIENRKFMSSEYFIIYFHRLQIFHEINNKNINNCTLMALVNVRALMIIIASELKCNYNTLLVVIISSMHPQTFEIIIKMKFLCSLSLYDIHFTRWDVRNKMLLIVTLESWKQRTGKCWLHTAHSSEMKWKRVRRKKNFQLSHTPQIIQLQCRIIILMTMMMLMWKCKRSNCNFHGRIIKHKYIWVTYILSSLNKQQFFP